MMKGFDARLLAALLVSVQCAHAQVSEPPAVPDPAQADAKGASAPPSKDDASIGVDGGRITWRGYVGAEGRLFGQSPAYPGQVYDGAAVLAQPEFAYESADRRYRFNATLFGRASISPRYESGDVREFVLQYRQGDFSLLAGMNRVFWGATESRHLVDVVNQSDLRENFAGDVKLGQLMVSASWQTSWGQLEAYALPAFRERRFPTSDDRLRFALPVSADAEFPDGHPLDWAVRASISRDDVDLHAYYFHGLDREPNLIPVFDGPGPPVELRPSYQKMDQFGADVQFAHGGWLFKGELMYRDKPDAHYWAGVGGFEYGISRVFGGVSDLALLAEYQFDNRPSQPSTEWPPPARRGIYGGVRIAVNDDASSEFKGGLVYDTSSNSRLWKAEYSRRLGDKWGLSLLYYGFGHVADNPALRDFYRDSYLGITLRRYL